VIPQALRRNCPEGAVVQEGWLPFKRLQRSGQFRRKAPQGRPLATTRRRFSSLNAAGGELSLQNFTPTANYFKA